MLLTCAIGATPANAWRWSHPYTIHGMRDAVNDLSCPSASLCVSVSGTSVFWSTNPRGGGSTWKKAALPAALEGAYLGGQTYTADGVSCPSSSFCVAIDEVGNTYVSTNPTAGAGSWHESEINVQTYPGLEAVSCASATLCGMLDITGEALTSSTPAGVPPLWISSKVSATKQADGYGIGCASTGVASVCAAVESDRRVAVSANPGASPASWQGASVATKTLSDVACGTVSLCVAAGGSGLLLVTHSPSALHSWKPVTIARARHANFTNVTCHGAALCLASTDSGEAVLATKPAASAPAWRAQGRIDSGSITALSCPTSGLCFVGSATNQIVVGHP